MSIHNDGWKQVGERDPFARHDIVRRSHAGNCDWCGNTRWRKGKSLGRVWQYAIWPDGGRLSQISGKFCSKACREIYHS